MLTTYNLTIELAGQDADPIAGATVTATLDKPDFTDSGVLLPQSQSVTTNSSGVAVLALVSNLVGTQDSRYQVQIRSARGVLLSSVTIQMPEAAASLENLVDIVPVTTEYSTAAAISAAQAAASALSAEADAEQTALDRVATDADRTVTSAAAATATTASAEAVASAQRINSLFWLGV